MAAAIAGARGHSIPLNNMPPMRLSRFVVAPFLPAAGGGSHRWMRQRFRILGLFVHGLDRGGKPPRPAEERIPKRRRQDAQRSAQVRRRSLQPGRDADRRSLLPGRKSLLLRSHPARPHAGGQRQGRPLHRQGAAQIARTAQPRRGARPLRPAGYRTLSGSRSKASRPSPPSAPRRRLGIPTLPLPSTRPKSTSRAMGNGESWR